MKREKIIFEAKVEYRVDGVLHREDGPAVEWFNGSKEWWVNGVPHRDNGPCADFATGTKVWRVRGVLHRCDGPAVERTDGRNNWHINGVDITEEITQWFTDTSVNRDYTKWTKEEQLHFKMRWN